MAKYIIHAESIGYVHLIVEAPDQEKAEEIALETDGSEWWEEDCGWEYNFSLTDQLEEDSYLLNAHAIIKE
jgi:hypothetical protein|tara:strand:+ start:138 stop:350 length:213 start_codon:yes stop_codon:yes gene_type:complete